MNDSPSNRATADDEEQRLRERLKRRNQDRRKSGADKNPKAQDEDKEQDGGGGDAKQDNNSKDNNNKDNNNNDTTPSKKDGTGSAAQHQNASRRRRRRGGRRRNRNGPPRGRGGPYPEGWYGNGNGPPPRGGGDPYRYDRGGPPPPYYYDRRYDGGGGYGGGYGPRDGPPDGYGRRYDGHGWGGPDEGRYRDRSRERRGRDGERRYRRERRRDRSRSFSVSRSRSPSRSRSGSSRSYSPSPSRSPDRSRSRSVGSDDDNSNNNGKSKSNKSNGSKSKGGDKHDGSDKDGKFDRKKSGSENNNNNDDDDDENKSASNNKASSSSKRSRSNDSHNSSSKSKRSRSRRSRSRSNPRSSGNGKNGSDALTKDRRTVFVSQLVMRADERDIRRYFRRKAGCKVNDVILLRDRRTGRHKGCAYVELGRLEDVPVAVEGHNGKVPDFQRFPILVRASEAERNYEEEEQENTATGVAAAAVPPVAASPLPAQQQQQQQPLRYRSQNIYVGSIDRCVTQAQLYAIFSQFGTLDSPVGLQIDPTTGMSRGFAFLSFHDAKDANLAIQTMSGQKLAGRPLKTGWANHSSAPGVEAVTSDEFPDDSAERIQKAHVVLTQLTGSGLMAMASTAQMVLRPATTVIAAPVATPVASYLASAAVPVPTVHNAHITNAAEAALNAALGLPAKEAVDTVASSDGVVAVVEPVPQPPPVPVRPTVSSVTATDSSTVATAVVATEEETTVPPAPDTDAKEIVGTQTLNILVHNMFDKNEETDEGWQNDIREDFVEECEKYGKIQKCVVMHLLPGGRIYASFDTVESAQNCALALAGRWFDKRQLRVEYVEDDKFPKEEEELKSER